MTKQTIELHVTITDKKHMTKVMIIAAGTKGVKGLEFVEDKEKQDQEKLEMKGDDVDIAGLVRTLKKNGYDTKIFKVTPD